MIERTITVRAAAGLHARVAAELVRLAQEYAGQVQLSTATTTVDARSILSLMTIDVGAGDRVRVAVSGPDPDGFLDLVETLLSSP